MKQAIIFTFILATLLIIPFSTNAQNPQFEAAPSEIKSRFKDREKLIRGELEGLQTNEWVGTYWAQEGLIDGALFLWSPSNGFVVRSGNDFHRGTEMINYGSTNFNGKLLTLSPENLEKTKHTYTISTSFVPVKWDKQHWLIPADKLALFSYAVNSGDYDEINSFFVKEEDSKKSNQGLPDVPKEYQKYLKLKPIKAIVGNVKINDSAYSDFTLTLNAGKAEGIIEDMKLYLVKVKDVLLSIRVTEVQMHKSTAVVVSIGLSGEYNKEIKPKIGWEFTNKLPRGY